MRLWSVSALLLCYLLAAADTGDDFVPFKPPWSDDKKFQPKSRKTDFCSTSATFGKGFQKSLAGRKISVVMMPNPPYILYNDATSTIEGGFLVEVWQEVCRRTGILWRESTAVVDAPDSSRGETYDGWIHWAVDNYDIVVGDFAATAARNGEGFRFGFPILNESPQLIGQLKVHHMEWYLQLFSFMRPFTLSLWLAIIASFMFVAFVYGTLETQEYLLEAKEYVLVGIDDIEHSHTDHIWWRNLLQSLFLTVASFTCGGVFRPRTFTGKCFVLSWTFAALVLVSSYTANMASMLVISDTAETRISSIEDAIEKRLPVCVYPGGAYDDFVKKEFPSLTIKYPDSWGYDNVRNGNCVAMVKDRQSFTIHRGLQKHNAECDLDYIGQPLLEVHGSFVSKSDSSEFCTDTVLDVINSALHDMSNDGWLKTKKDVFIIQASDQRCGNHKINRSESAALGIENLSGLFYVQIVVAIVCLVAQKYEIAWEKSSLTNGSNSVPLQSPRASSKQTETPKKSRVSPLQACQGAGYESSESMSDSDANTQQTQVESQRSLRMFEFVTG